METPVLAFATLFLGLVLGPQPVEVLAGDGVAAMEVWLDGQRLATLEAPPWRLVCDFGAELAPHRLEAVGLDSGRRELARAEQWINLPRPPAEAQVVLEGGEHGVGVTARLAWQSVTGEAPRRVKAWFDGAPLQVEDPARIELPPHDPAQLHFLRVELDFSDLLTSSVELTFGGGFAERLGAELTAVPVEVDGGLRLTRQDLEGRLRAGGVPLRVVAVDEGLAELVIVRDPGAQAGLVELGRRARTRLQRSQMLRGSALDALRYAGGLKGDVRVRFLSPVPQSAVGGGHRFELFTPSPEFTHHDGGLYWLAANAHPALETPGEERLAEAVAVAGMTASGRNRRRAVLLLTGPEPAADGRLTPAEARRYLERLRVPLVAWSPVPETRRWRLRKDRSKKAPRRSNGPAGWEAVVPIHSLAELDRQARALARRLERQRIVWLEGTHLPQSVALWPPLPGVRLAGVEEPPAAVTNP